MASEGLFLVRSLFIANPFEAINQKIMEIFFSLAYQIMPFFEPTKFSSGVCAGFFLSGSRKNGDFENRGFSDCD